MRRSMLFPAIVLASCLAAAGCRTNEATGRSQLIVLSAEDEIRLGEEAMPELVKEYGGEVSDSVLREYVRDIGMNLRQHTEAKNPDLPWQFTLLDSDVINAFALPGGKVFMSRGLMTRMTNEAQLAGVLGHEIGHVTAQHVNERISQAITLQVGVGAVALGTRRSEGSMARYVPVIVGAAGQGFLLKFSRDQESEADHLGMRYMARSGYHPRAQMEVMQILNDAMEEAGGARGPEFLSTHPYPETRIARIRENLRTIYTNADNNPRLSYHEERFQRIARPRLDAIEREKRRAMGNENREEALLAALLAQPQAWCAHCREAPQ